MDQDKTAAAGSTPGRCAPAAASDSGTDAGLLISAVVGMAAAKAAETLRPVFEQLARIDLEAARAKAAECVSAAQCDRDEAYTRYEPLRAALDRLEAAQADAGTLPPEPDVTDPAWLDWDMRRAAGERRAVKLAELHSQWRANAAPLIVANGAARDRLLAAGAELARYDSALAADDCLTTPEGKRTAAYREFLVRSGGWIDHLGADEKNTPTGQLARRIVRDACRAAGIDDEIRRDALAAAQARGELAERVAKVNSAPGDPFLRTPDPLADPFGERYGLATGLDAGIPGTGRHT